VRDAEVVDEGAHAVQHDALAFAVAVEARPFKRPRAVRALHGERQDDLRRGHLGQEAGETLAVMARQRERRRHGAVQRRRRGVAPGFLQQEAGVGQRQRLAAAAFRQAHAEPAQFAHLAPEFRRVLARILFRGAHRRRRRFGREESARRFLDESFLVVE